MTESESLLDSVRERLADHGAGRTDADACLKSIQTLVSEPDILTQFEDAFPEDMKRLMPAWKSVLKDTWDNVISRPRAWKLVAAALKKNGVDI